MDGLSPIADVDMETSFSTQHGDLGFPDLDVSYGSGGTPRPPVQQYGQQYNEAGNGLPIIENEPLAYFK